MVTIDSRVIVDHACIIPNVMEEAKFGNYNCFGKFRIVRNL